MHIEACTTVNILLNASQQELFLKHNHDEAKQKPTPGKILVAMVTIGQYELIAKIGNNPFQHAATLSAAISLALLEGPGVIKDEEKLKEGCKCILNGKSLVVGGVGVHLSFISASSSLAEFAVAPAQIRTRYQKPWLISRLSYSTR